MVLNPQKKIMRSILILLGILFLQFNNVYGNQLIQIENKIDEIILKAIISSSIKKSDVIGIMPTVSDESLKNKKVEILVDSSLENLIINNASLADRNKLNDLKNEWKIKKELSEEVFLGSKIGKVKGVDYFIWAELKKLSEQINLRVFILDSETTLIKSTSKGYFSVTDVLLLDKDILVDDYVKWSKSIEDEKSSKEFYKWTTIAGAVTYLVMGGIVPGCKDYKEKGYGDEWDCKYAEHPWSQILAYSSFTAMGVGGVMWGITASNENALIEEGEKNNYLNVYFVPNLEKPILKLVYKF